MGDGDYGYLLYNYAKIFVSGIGIGMSFSISRTSPTLLLHQSYKENGLMPPIKKRAGPSKHRLLLKHEDQQRVVNFINNYAEDNAIVLPGRHPEHKLFSGKLLPSHVTKAAVWRLYKESMATLGM